MAGRHAILGSFVLVAIAATTIPPHAATTQRNILDDQIVMALESLRDHMSEGWPELGVPPLDPLTLGHVNIDIHNNGTTVKGALAEVTMNGLSTFNIDLVHSSPLQVKVEIGLGIPILDIAGNYNFTGQSGVFPIFGVGPFWLDALNVTISAMVDLGQTEEGVFGVTVLELDITCPTTDIHFENIMGGGEMADFVNDLLSAMGPDFLQAIEDEYMPWLEEALIHEINQILQGGGGEGKKQKDESVNDYFDLVFANLRQSIIENGQDPLPLPADSDNFTVTLFNRTTEGEVEAGPGKLLGMSSVHRAGDMELHYVGQENEVVWKGEVGLIDLEVDYRFALTLPLLGKDLSFTAKISFMHLSFETDVFLHQSEIVLPYCNITELGPVHFKEKGAGPLDSSLYNALINLLLGELEGLVTTAVEDAVCALLEDAFASSG
ncbi:uncharacterized protein LOC127004331 isoform X2 [Eriocheir sinensis]|uniref:uncharacterized protein LOC127004331 isoform X2 n=1 Tax=Eriocheir sinensis TaxID=95602 RepID=UPI0021C76D36|nr:uncharacterized protein LOC127004331 isoform X2 [Eriocheir sinensis]